MRDYRESSEVLDAYPLSARLDRVAQAKRVGVSANLNKLGLQPGPRDRYGPIKTGNVNYTLSEFIKSLFGRVPRRFR